MGYLVWISDQDNNITIISLIKIELETHLETQKFSGRRNHIHDGYSLNERFPQDMLKTLLFK